MYIRLLEKGKKQNKEFMRANFYGTYFLWNSLFVLIPSIDQTWTDRKIWQVIEMSYRSIWLVLIQSCNM